MPPVDGGAPERLFKLWSTGNVVRYTIACPAATSGPFPAGLFANPLPYLRLTTARLYSRGRADGCNRRPGPGNDTQQANFQDKPR